VYEYVYEYGKNPCENALPTYSYTYSYTRISSCLLVRDLAKKLGIELPFFPSYSLIDPRVANVRQFGRECPWLRASVGRPGSLAGLASIRCSQMYQSWPREA
jgi:hypothetical protein